MGWTFPSDNPTPGPSAARRLVLLGVAMLVATVLTGLIGLPVAASGGSQPEVQLVGDDVSPTPDSPRPQINPVSPTDDTVVRPDEESGQGVNGLPTSGIGFTSPADDDVRRWTNLAIAALALNAVVLFGIALWSLRRRRV